VRGRANGNGTTCAAATRVVMSSDACPPPYRPLWRNGPCVSRPHEPSVFVHRRHRLASRQRTPLGHRDAAVGATNRGQHREPVVHEVVARDDRRPPDGVVLPGPSPASCVEGMTKRTADRCVSNVRASPAKRRESTARRSKTVIAVSAGACAC